LRGKHKR